MSKVSPKPKAVATVDQYLQRRKRKQIGGAALTILVGFALVFADRQGMLLSRTAEWVKYDGKSFRVVRVIDGDTLDVDMADGRFPATRVRFWGIDTPETAKPRDGKVAEPFADEAFAFTRNICEGKQVTLKLDTHQVRDRHGRLLAYVILPDGTMLNESLLLEGFARFENRFPHQHLERFELLEKQARFEKKGRWKK